ncbi:hypothetical protein D9M72_559400 [compost metagenome]
MLGGVLARRRVGNAPWRCARLVQKGFQATLPHTRTSDHHERDVRNLGDCRQIPLGLQRRRIRQMRIDGNGAGRPHAERVAVRWRLREGDETQCTTGTRLVVDDHRLTDRLRQLSRDDSCNAVGRCTRSEWNDERHRLARESLRLRADRRQGGECQCAECA